MSIYGPITDGGAVELAARDTLRAWMATYQAEVEAQVGREPGTLPRIRSWTNAPDFEHWPEDQLPCMVLICPGTFDRPSKDGEGQFQATWELRAAVVVSTSTRESTIAVAKLYAAAARAAVMQHPSLGGFATAVDWLGEAYDQLPSETGRSLAAGEVAFAIEVPDVLDARAGLATPPEDPLEEPDDWPPITSIDIDVERKELA